MKTILIPVFDHRISSRLDCAENFLLIKIVNNIVQSTETIKIIAKNQLEKLNVILSMRPDIVICNGITDIYENEFLKNNIKVIPWVQGQFRDVVKSFMKGKLIK